MRTHDATGNDEPQVEAALTRALATLTLTPAQRASHLARLRAQVTNDERISGVGSRNGVDLVGVDTVSPATPYPKGPRGTRRGRLSHTLELVSAGIVVILIAAAALLARSLVPASGMSSPPAAAPARQLSTVFAVSYPNSEASFQPLDPRTLADQPGRQSMALPTTWAVSGDGSTLVALDFAGSGRATIAIRDGTDWARRVDLPSPLQGMQDTAQLDRDGSRLLSQQHFDPNIWHVVDLTTGALLSTITTTSPRLTGDTPMGAEQLLLSPDGTRIYDFIFVDHANATGPQPLRIVAYDAATGHEVGQLSLPGIPVGAWQTAQTGSAEPVSHFQQPGIAISPDGHTIAIVHPGGERVTLVNAAQLTVERTVTVARPVSFVHRLLTALGVLPRAAAAKSLDGVTRTALYAPDGQHLYVYGHSTTVDSTTGMQSLGLSRIDLQSGQSTEALSDAIIHQIAPAPDRQSLYVLATLPSAAAPGQSAPQVIQRLDAATLQPLASRTRPGVYGLALVVGSPAGR